MNSSLELALAKKVLPGFGFFGSYTFDRLKVSVDAVVDEVQLEVRNKTPSYLNITRVLFYGKNGELLDFAKVCRSATISSNFEKEPLNVHSLLKAGALIHSDKEKIPSLILDLHSSIYISRIEIANRSDSYGVRSKHLVVISLDGGVEIGRFDNFCGQRLLSAYREILEGIGFSNDFTLAGMNQVDIKANEIRAALAKKISDGSLKYNLPTLISFLPTYDPNPLVNNDVLIFMGGVIANLILDTGTTETAQLNAFKKILITPKRIIRAIEHASIIYSHQYGKPTTLIAGKHKIGRSELSEKKEENLKVMNIVRDQLKAWSIDSVICYGTLLGAVRNQAFIAHDDDVDMLFFYGAKSEAEMMKKRLEVLEKFKEAGYDTHNSGINFTVIPPGCLVGVDLFPEWSNKKQTSLMMEHYKYRMIDTDVLLPTKTIEFYGHEFDVPNQVERFLEERYGTSWSQANPFYEWPWELELHEEWPRRQSVRSLNAKRTVMVAWGQVVGTTETSPPKNSPALISKAISENFDAIEIDVRLSKDSVYVLGHDDVIIGKQGSKIQISKTSSKQLSQFNLGDYQKKANPVITLEKALLLMEDKVVMLDPRVSEDELPKLRKTVDKAGFEPGKILFCGYGDAGVKALNVHFPESVILYKYYGSHVEIDDFVLEELMEKQVDGLMLFWPMHYEDCKPFMKRLKKYGLQVLFYVHGSWPARGEVDKPEASLSQMITAGADYVTSTGSQLSSFKKLVKQPLIDSLGINKTPKKYKLLKGNR
ncbi:MAG: LicD family protein [Robiginitomaculum sp.]